MNVLRSGPYDKDEYKGNKISATSTFTAKR